MTKSANPSVVVGVFQNDARAQEAVRALKAAGFTDDQIGVVSHDRSGATTKTGAAAKGSNVVDGATTGLAAGAGVGALWALGIAAGVLPVIGPVVAGGILGSVLASAAGGAAIAGLVGALIGLGLPEEDAHYYEAEFKGGRSIVTVRADGRYDEAWKILHAHDAYNRHVVAAANLPGTPLNVGGKMITSSVKTGTVPATTATTTAAPSADGDQTVEEHEEQLRARKTRQKVGEARVRKVVTTEQQSIEVPVTREEIVVTRRSAKGRVTSGTIREGEEIRIPVSEEQVHVEKETVVTGEVTVGKRKVTETKKVTGSVRKEEVKVDTDGQVYVQGETKPKRRS